MSEGMALEKLAEEHARLQGYFTLVRVPFKPPRAKGKKHRGNTDFDVLGYHPRDHKVLIIEVKAYGPPEVYRNWSYRPWERSITTRWVGNVAKKWSQFVKLEKGRAWGLRVEDLGEIRVVIPGFWDVDRKGFEKWLESRIWRKHKFRTKVCVVPIHDLVLDTIRLVSEDKIVRRVRYADTALEAFRWLTRRPEHHHEQLSAILWSKSEKAQH